MYRAAGALKTFFSGFGLRAFQENTIPDDAVMPYITFSIAAPEWNQKASIYARVWERTTSNDWLIQKGDEIARAVGIQKKIPFEGGYLIIWPETPATQIQVDGEARYAYLNFSINAYNLPGV